MRKLSHISLVVSAISLVLLVGTRYVLGGWQNFLFAPLFTFLVFLVLGIVLNWKQYLSFFTLKTTKHGFNTGTTILIFILMLSGVNYYSVKWNKNFDLTKNNLYTLSPQSIDAVKGLKSKAKVYVFHLGKVAEEGKRPYRNLLELFAEQSTYLDFEFYDTYEHPELSKKYVKQHDLQNRKIFAYIDYANKVVGVDHPMNEEQFTQAFIKLTRSQASQVYFTQGHSEWDIMAVETEPFGLGLLRKTLQDYSFEVSSLDLATINRVPGDASVVAILGPKSHFAESEIKALINYAQKGGKFLIALDPGVTHNLEPLLKELGLVFKNNFIHDPTSALGMLTVILKDYSDSHSITKDFGDRMVVMNLASEVGGDKGSKDNQINEILFSSSSSFMGLSPGEKSNISDRKSFPLAVAVKTKKSSSILFGDSDIFRSELLYVFSNRDLAVNTIAYLSEQKDLISIKPKMASVTEIKITRMNNMIFVVFVVLIPIILFSMGIVLWLRRRGGR